MIKRSIFFSSSHSACTGLTFFLIFACATLAAQNKEIAPTTVVITHAYEVGGVSIRIPPPTSDQVELGSNAPVLMWLVTPETNRFVATFVLADDLPLLSKNKSASLARYSSVQIPKQYESMDFSKSFFKSLRGFMDKDENNSGTESTKAYEEELNRKLGLLNSDSGRIILEKKIPLGRYFSKTNMYGFGEIGPITQDGETYNMVTGAAVVRVKNRVLFAYITSIYKDKDTLKWVRKTTKEWAEAILNANK